MKLFFVVCGIMSFGKICAQDFAMLEIFKDLTYSVSSEVNFLYEEGGQWVSKSGAGKPDKLVLDYVKQGQVEGFRSVRYLPTGELHYDYHATWDGDILKVLMMRNNTNTLYLRENLDDMEAGCRLANLATLPWMWLMISSEDKLMVSTPFEYNETIRKRFLDVAPQLKSGAFFELPYAKGVMCKISLQEDGVISGFTVRSMSGEHERSLEFSGRKMFDVGGNLTCSVPTHIIETLASKGEPRVRRITDLLSFVAGAGVPKDLLQIDASKASSMWDEEAKAFLPLNRK